jgi:hypothetical protein
MSAEDIGHAAVVIVAITMTVILLTVLVNFIRLAVLEMVDDLREEIDKRCNRH